MDIIYRKDTLYVYLKEIPDEEIIKTLESRVDNIMVTYNIENLVIATSEQSDESDIHLHEFESKFNRRHRKKVIIK